MMAPLAVVHLLMIACAAFGLHATAREVDHSDSRRAREAVAAAFTHQLKRLESVTLNNAVYTEAWKAVGGAQVDRAWALENWTVAPVGLPGHHGILLLDPAGRPIVGTRAGRAMSPIEMGRMASLVGPTVRKLAAQGSASTRGVVDRNGAPVMVAAANVVPEPPDRTAANMAGAKKRLVLVHPVDAALLATMNETIGGDDLRLGSGADEENMVVFAADRGPALRLSWRSREPGRAAMIRSLRVVAPILLLVTLLLILAMRAGLASSRALRIAATRDSLTGLLNRAAFSAKLDHRLKERLPVVLGLIDLDGFKAVNDRYGHLAGDDLLRRFGEALIEAARPDAIAGRLGGDEFAFLSPSRAGADRLIAELRLSLARSAGPAPVVQASIGIATARPGDDARAVISAADAALYADKRMRKGSPDATVGDRSSAALAASSR